MGAPAGAFNAAAFIAGVARHAGAAYSLALAARAFVNPARVLRGRPVIDVDHALNYTTTDLDDARHERVLHSLIALHCVASDSIGTSAWWTTSPGVQHSPRAALRMCSGCVPRPGRRCRQLERRAAVLAAAAADAEQLVALRLSTSPRPAGGG